MNKQIMKSAGFGKAVEDVANGLCPFCQSKINSKEFRDDLSLKEFHISGLCQNCQDKTFS